MKLLNIIYFVQRKNMMILSLSPHKTLPSKSLPIWHDVCMWIILGMYNYKNRNDIHTYIYFFWENVVILISIFSLRKYWPIDIGIHYSPFLKIKIDMPRRMILKKRRVYSHCFKYLNPIYTMLIELKKSIIIYSNWSS